MDITLSVDDRVIEHARRRAEAMGKSVDQIILDYLEEFSGQTERKRLAEEWLRLSRLSNGDSRGWKFNRDEIHERR